MKKIALLLLVVVTTSLSAYSQSAFQGWTVKAGVNLSKIDGSSKMALESSYKVGFTAGFALDWKFTDVVGMSVDVLYSRQGGKTALGEVTVTENSNYINLPVMANFHIVEGLVAKVGIQPSWFISADDEIKGGGEAPQEHDLLSAYKVMDFSIPVGICYEFKHRVSIELRYHFGLTDIVKEAPNFPDYKARNSYASLTLGYRF